VCGARSRRIIFAYKEIHHAIKFQAIALNPEDETLMVM
jgi:hypothetical protein